MFAPHDIPFLSSQLLASSSLHIEYLLLLTAFFSVLVGAIIVWLETYEFPRQRRFKEVWLHEHSQELCSEKVLMELVAKLGKKSACCSHCGHNEMQLWDIRDKFLVVRCTNCKINRTMCLSSEPIIDEIRDTTSALYRLLETTNKKRDEMLGQYLLRRLHFNYFKKKHKDPLISAVTFRTLSAA